MLKAKSQQQASQTCTINAGMAQWLFGWGKLASLASEVAKGYQSRQWGALLDIFQESPSIEVDCWRLSFRESDRGVCTRLCTRVRRVQKEMDLPGARSLSCVAAGKLDVVNLPRLRGRA